MIATFTNIIISYFGNSSENKQQKELLENNNYNKFTLVKNK